MPVGYVCRVPAQGQLTVIPVTGAAALPSGHSPRHPEVKPQVLLERRCDEAPPSAPLFQLVKRCGVGVHPAHSSRVNAVWGASEYQEKPHLKESFHPADRFLSFFSAYFEV